MKFRDDERVSLGDGCYITGAHANRLARMAEEAGSDDRPTISLKGLSDTERRALLAGSEPPRINLGELGPDELCHFLCMVSDRNKLLKRGE